MLVVWVPLWITCWSALPSINTAMYAWQESVYERTVPPWMVILTTIDQLATLLVAFTICAVGGFAFAIMAHRYVYDMPVLRKNQQTGARARWCRWLLLPAAAVSKLCVVTWTLFSKEPAWTPTECPQVFVGRFPWRARDLPLGITHIVDVQDELERAPHSAHAHYLCIPCLDDTFASVDTLVASLQRYTQTICVTDRVYVHCLFGHSRSAVCGGIIAAILQGTTWRHEMEALRSKRPNVHWTLRQADVAEEVVSQIRDAHVQLYRCNKRHAMQRKHTNEKNNREYLWVKYCGQRVESQDGWFTD